MMKMVILGHELKNEEKMVSGTSFNIALYACSMYEGIPMLNSWIPFPCYASWSDILLNHISNLIFFPYSLFSPFARDPFHHFIHVVSLVRRRFFFFFFFSSNGILSWWILFRSCPRGLCSTCSCSTHPCCWCCTYGISHANSMVRMDCILLQNEHWRMV